MSYETMTVAELRTEMGNRGLPKQEKGKKFTKPELIERLKLDDEMEGRTEVNTEAEENKTEEHVSMEEAFQNMGKQLVDRVVQPETEQEEKKVYIVRKYKTLEEIEKKYGKRKKQYVYDERLKTGSFVVFVHYVEALDGNIYKKLRTAKVVGVNRKKELVRVETLLGEQKELSFDDLLYIRGEYGKEEYPSDIAMFLKHQRTKKGRELMNEKFGTDGRG